MMSLVIGVAAQSGRIQPDVPPPPPANVMIVASVSAEQMFVEARDYFKNKVAEFQAKKIPYNEKLDRQTKQEQRDLAIRYAATLTARKELSNDEIFFLGRLHWLAESDDNAFDVFSRYLAATGIDDAKAQFARSVLTVVDARKSRFDDAMRRRTEYLNQNPVDPFDRYEIESELAKAFRAAGNFERAAVYGADAFRVARVLFAKQTSRNRGINDIYDAGIKSFEIYRAAKRFDDAERILEELRKAASFLESPSLYYSAVHERIRLMIETGRKTQALGYYRESLTRAPKEFMVKASQDDVVRRLQRREKHYKLLGEAAPELPDIAEWFGRPVKLAELRGKVIVLDFWATWCGPCISAFPSINEWNKKYSGDGLVILGVTGFTGSVEGDQATETEELGFLRRFKKEYELEYDFVIGRNFDNQKIYGADSIPTTIIIDRKGIVRYAEAGAGREPEIEREIVRLLAEK